MLHSFKTFDKDRLTLEEALALEAFGESLQSGYENHAIDEPEWVTDAMNKLRKYIVSTVEDQIDNKIKMAEIRLEALKTPGEKREALQKELAKLRKARKTVA